jgi:hypothetical protein
MNLAPLPSRRLLQLLAAALMVTVLAAMTAGPAFAGGYYPPPKDECPEGDVPGNPNEDPDTGTDKQRLCHRTGSETNPFVNINVSCNAEGHLPPPPQHPELDGRQDAVISNCDG